MGMEDYKLEDLVTIVVKCKECGGKGEAITFKPILEKEGSILAKQLEENGYAESICDDCVKEEEK